MKMLFPGRQVADILVLLILSVATVYGCPHNIERRVGDCLINFKNYYRAVTGTDTALFTGIDVETLRNICVQFQHAFRCIEEIKSNCPYNKQAEIIKAYDDTVNLNHLCKRSNLYEHYAMTQSCFTRAHTETTHCYSTFRTVTRNLLVGVRETDKPSIDEYCSQLRTLGGCIEGKVMRCGPIAASLSQDLVKATVPLSQYCEPAIIVIIHPLTTTSPGRTRARQGPYLDGSGTTIKITPPLLLLSVVLVLILR